MELTKLASKPLLLSLIKDDLKNTRLVSGLDKLGLDSGKYYLSLGETIVSLISLGDAELDEKLWEDYSDSLSELAEEDLFDDPKRLDRLAERIYIRLVRVRERLQQKT